jgi:hypothetical protein
MERSEFTPWRSPEQTPQTAQSGRGNVRKPVGEGTRNANDEPPIRPRRPSTVYIMNPV